MAVLELDRIGFSSIRIRQVQLVLAVSIRGCIVLLNDWFFWKQSTIFHNANHPIDLSRGLPVFEADEPKNWLHPNQKYHIGEAVTSVKQNDWLFAVKNDIQNVEAYQDLVNADKHKNPQHLFEKNEAFPAVKSDQGDWRRDQCENGQDNCQVANRVLKLLWHHKFYVLIQYL